MNVYLLLISGFSDPGSHSKIKIFQFDPYWKIFGDILDHWSTTDDSEDDDQEKLYKFRKKKWSVNKKKLILNKLLEKFTTWKKEDLDKIHKKDNLDDLNAAQQEMMEVDLAAEAMEIAEMADMQEQDAEMDIAMNDVGND